MKVGIQLYSVRESMAKDPIETIRKVVNVGYKNLEIANHFADTDNGVGFGVPAKDIKALLDETGASIVSGHISPFIPERMDSILEYHNEIGTKFFGVAIDFFKDKDEVLRKCETYNQIGEKCKSAGIELLYHNHFQEFQHFGDDTVIDLILKNTDPNFLKFELDTYWAMRSGNDPIDVLKKLGKRLRLVHQKDFTKGYEDQINLLKKFEENNDVIEMDNFVSSIDSATFTEVGTGIMDIQTIINTANEYCDCEYIILEQDYTKLEEIESIKVSMDSFKKFQGIEW